MRPTNAVFIHIAVCIIVCIFGAIPMAVSAAAAAPFRGDRFFHDGDGVLHITSRKNGATFDGRYRLASGSYDPRAIKAICHVFDAPYTASRAGVSMRLIAFLDFLQDRFNPQARITVTSGYRSPRYNTKLRRNGALAAKASLHQYGMAADFSLQGVPAKHVWEFVKTLGFGGTGYYQGESVHVDVGPARFWDQRTSGVGTGISDDNKLIGVVTDFDRYASGENMTLRFIRMTAFPIGVSPQFALVSGNGQAGASPVAVFHPAFAVDAKGECPRFADIDAMAAITWHLPADLPAGSYAVRVTFCDRSWTAMPPEITTPVFEVVAGLK
jgi:uncharacterized protein YcbK (DUF882 family)